MDQPFAPGNQAPATVRVTLTLPPATPAIWNPVGESLHVAIRRAGLVTPILDTTFVISDTVSAVLPVPLDHSIEQFVATAEVRYGAMVLFLAFDAVRLHAGTDTAITLVADYVGPGARAVSYALGARDTTLGGGDTASLAPLVLDSLGQAIANVPVRYVVARPALVQLDSSGVVTAAAAAAPDTARITGYLPMGLASGLLVRLVPNITPPVGVRHWLGGAGTTAQDSTDWFHPANWDPAGVPGSGDTVLIDNSLNDPVFTGRDTVAAMRIVGGSLFMGRGTLVILGDFSTENEAGALEMNQPEDTVRVLGNAVFAGRIGEGSSDGVLFIGGDFEQRGRVSFRASGNHRTILNGTVPQRLRSEGSRFDELDNFQHLDITNSSGQILIGNEDVINVAGKLRVLTPVTIDNGSGGNGDVILNVGDSLIMAAGSRLTVVQLSLGGGMAVAGDFAPQAEASFTVILAGGNQRIQPGLDYRDVRVEGDAWLDGATRFDGGLFIAGSLTTNGHALTVTGGLQTQYGTGRLIMHSPADTVMVGGDATFAGDSLPGDLTAGVLRIAGAVDVQSWSPGLLAFRATPPHRTVLDGAGPQSIATAIGAVFGHLTIASGGGVLTGLEQAFDVSGTLRITTPVSLGGGGGVTIAESLVTVAGSTIELGVSLAGGMAVAGNFGVAALHLTGLNQVIQPDLAYANIYIHGSAALVARTQASAVSVINGGSLTLGGHTLQLSGMFNVGSVNTGETSTLVMQQPTDSLIVGGDAYFAGGPTDGLLTSGVLVVGGTLYQLANSTAFQPSGTHRTVMNGAAAAIEIEHTGNGSNDSYFRHLQIASGLQVRSFVTVTGTLSGGNTAAPPVVSGPVTQINAAAVDVSGLVFSGVRLSVVGSGALHIDSVTFEQQDATGLQLNLSHPGAAQPFTFTGLRFLTAPTSGNYISANDANPGDGQVLTINLAASVPPDGSAHTTTGSGAVVNWLDALPSPFTALPNMAAAREGHRSVLLDNGTVLVVGGLTTTAETFDSATAQFTATTGGTSLFREGLTATKLYDGRVLVTGGGQVFPATTRTAEVYDPATGLFAPTDSLGDSVVVCCRGRRYHTATLLPSGDVLVTGGEGVNVNVLYRLRTAETWSFISEQFTVRAAPARARSRHTASLLPGNRILICGGQTNFVDTGDSHCEIYNATADSWSAAGSMTMERVSHTATVLADGRVLLTGGSRLRQDQAFRVASAELYDPATGIFTATGSMAFRRQFHDAVMLADGRVLITGGLDQNSEPVLTAEIYDPDTGTFSPAGNMVAGRNRHSTVRLADGRVLITGGQSSGTAAEIYRPCCVSP